VRCRIARHCAGPCRMWSAGHQAPKKRPPTLQPCKTRLGVPWAPTLSEHFHERLLLEGLRVCDVPGPQMVETPVCVYICCVRHQRAVSSPESVLDLWCLSNTKQCSACGTCLLQVPGGEPPHIHGVQYQNTLPCTLYGRAALSIPSGPRRYILVKFRVQECW
jgi:hypothetical protein